MLLILNYFYSSITLLSGLCGTDSKSRVTWHCANSWITSRLNIIWRSRCSLRAFACSIRSSCRRTNALRGWIYLCRRWSNEFRRRRLNRTSKPSFSNCVVTTKTRKMLKCPMSVICSQRNDSSILKTEGTVESLPTVPRLLRKHVLSLSWLSRSFCSCVCWYLCQ